MRKYQPSNGTEGEWFTDKYCWKCQNCDPDPEGKKQCHILGTAMACSITDEEYPKEWTYDKDDNPICTAHKPWDWDELGDPDDPDNQNYQQPEDPNQLSMITEIIGTYVSFS